MPILSLLIKVNEEHKWYTFSIFTEFGGGEINETSLVSFVGFLFSNVYVYWIYYFLH